MLNHKLSTALTAHATTVKNALEAAVQNGGVAMPETDATGHTSASDMEQMCIRDRPQACLQKRPTG